MLLAVTEFTYDLNTEYRCVDLLNQGWGTSGPLDFTELELNLFLTTCHLAEVDGGIQ